jgi:hypothetical protein
VSSGIELRKVPEREIGGRDDKGRRAWNYVPEGPRPGGRRVAVLEIISEARRAEGGFWAWDRGGWIARAAACGALGAAGCTAGHETSAGNPALVFSLPGWR